MEGESLGGRRGGLEVVPSFQTARLGGPGGSTQGTGTTPGTSRKISGNIRS